MKMDDSKVSDSILILIVNQKQLYYYLLFRNLD